MVNWKEVLKDMDAGDGWLLKTWLESLLVGIGARYTRINTEVSLRILSRSSWAYELIKDGNILGRIQIVAGKDVIIRLEFGSVVTITHVIAKKLFLDVLKKAQKDFTRRIAFSYFLFSSDEREWQKTRRKFDLPDIDPEIKKIIRTFTNIIAGSPILEG